ncbi:MAG: hypothetical protein ACRDO4_08850 [Nocardioides sp.]
MHRHLNAILSIALTSGLVVAGAALPTPAQATGLPIPIDCSDRRVVLEWDGLTYDLQGTCGVVVIAADDTEVSIPAARKVVVRGEGNVVHAKPADRVRVLGRDQGVDVVSVRALRIASPSSVVTVTGLAEQASVGERRARLTADRLSELVVEGHHHTVRVRRGTTVVRNDGRHNTIRVHRRG